MSGKITLEQFSQEAKRDHALFDELQTTFEDSPSLIRQPRDAVQPYSYVWYQDPKTQKKIAIRVANKNVDGYVLGAGTYGRAKYGVDKYGRLYAVRIQHNFIESYSLQNLSERAPSIQNQIINSITNAIPSGTWHTTLQIANQGLCSYYGRYASKKHARSRSSDWRKAVSSIAIGRVNTI